MRVRPCTTARTNTPARTRPPVRPHARHSRTLGIRPHAYPPGGRARRGRVRSIPSPQPPSPHPSPHCVAPPARPVVGPRVHMPGLERSTHATCAPIRPVRPPTRPPSDRPTHPRAYAQAALSRTRARHVVICPTCHSLPRSRVYDESVCRNDRPTDRRKDRVTGNRIGPPETACYL